MNAGDARGRRGVVALEIVRPGPLCTVQDLGRGGHAAIGVPRSGAFDRGALRLANRLVGNPPGAAGLEITLGGLVARLHRACTVALTGAVCAGMDPGVALTLPAGATIALQAPRTGLRSYLALRGGIDDEQVLGSASTDMLSGLGPLPLRSGSRLALGTAGGRISGATAWTARPPGVLAIDPGPRTDLFTGDVLAALTGAPWTVRPDSDRIGVRLDGAVLTRRDAAELPSEPTLPGAIQVPADGRPIVFGPDAPVTGGYPVIAVVRELDLLAQVRPGDPVRFCR